MQEFSGGQLKIAGVVVGNWGGSGRGRGDSPMQVFNSAMNSIIQDHTCTEISNKLTVNFAVHYYDIFSYFSICVSHAHFNFVKLGKVC